MVASSFCAAFVHNHPPPRHHRTSQAARLQIRIAAEHNDNSSPEEFPVHFMTTKDIILPGETKTLTLRDEESIPLIQDCLETDCGRLALGVEFFSLEKEEGEAAEEELQIAQVASLCEIVGLTAAHEDQVLLDLVCVGRVRLQNMMQQYSPNQFQFTANCLYEPCGFSNNEKDDVQKALLLEKNILRLIQHSSRMEQKLQANKTGENKQPAAFIMDMYLDTRDEVTVAIAKELERQRHSSSWDLSASRCEEWKRLVATSWAVFQCLKDETLEARYRLRALDWDNLLERLKLAQYALREKELLLQGEMIAQDEEPLQGDSSIIDYSDAFQ